VIEPASLLLASASPRRRQLIQLGHWKISTAPSNVDESERAGELPADYVKRLAEAKARAAAPAAGPDQIILAADTTVVNGGEILGKPEEAGQARSMLMSLRGHTHQVFTALALLRMRDGKLLTELCITDVPMRNYSEAEIEAYVQSGDPLDKAGAYGIQHAGFHPVENMRGCYASVMGLPMCHLVRALTQFDVQPLADVPAGCQALLAYACPVSNAILRGERAG
jgi:septum formation protein